MAKKWNALYWGSILAASALWANYEETNMQEAEAHNHPQSTTQTSNLNTAEAAQISPYSLQSEPEAMIIPPFKKQPAENTSEQPTDQIQIDWEKHTPKTNYQTPPPHAGIDYINPFEVTRPKQSTLEKKIIKEIGRQARKLSKKQLKERRTNSNMSYDEYQDLSKQISNIGRDNPFTDNYQEEKEERATHLIGISPFYLNSDLALSFDPEKDNFVKPPKTEIEISPIENETTTLIKKRNFRTELDYRAKVNLKELITSKPYELIDHRIDITFRLLDEKENPTPYSLEWENKLKGNGEYTVGISFIMDFK